MVWVNIFVKIYVYTWCWSIIRTATNFLSEVVRCCVSQKKEFSGIVHLVQPREFCLGCAADCDLLQEIFTLIRGYDHNTHTQ